MSSPSTFAERFRARAPLLGTFWRTASPTLAEVMGSVPPNAGMDCVCLDMEHSALDRPQVDALLLAFRASGMPALVRTRDASANSVLSALDMGASGVMVPHVATGEQAQGIADAATYRTPDTPTGTRGYAGATRGAGWGVHGMGEAIARANASRLVIAQVEEREALDHIPDIVRANGLDAVFIGRSDLTVSFGHTDTKAAEVMEAVELVARTGSEAGLVVGTFTSDLDEIPHLRAMGVSFFILGSEHGMLLDGVRRFADDVRGRF